MKKLSRDNLEIGLTTNYAGEYTAVASEQYNYSTGEKGYVLSYYKGLMPSFNGEDFATLAELEAAMRQVQPDLRKWRLCR